MNNYYEKIDDLKMIKKDYGEKMMHLCRELFPTVLEYPGALYHILNSNFEKSKGLYDDIIKENKEYNFKDYIYYFFDNSKEEDNDTKFNKSVKELLEEAGYDIFECKSNEDIQKFRKYYANGEELCTFRDLNRINNHYIFFIVKKNVSDIKREAFSNPKREDVYSTSVLDLQFDKGTRQRVSIKSRYNHTVQNPDATYSNNLECIVPGLTKAFERDYEFNIGEEYKLSFELNHYVKARNGKNYKYNYEINNIHYCPNNIIIDNGNIVDTYADKSRYTFMDYFILDEKEKKLILYDQKINDSFIDGLQNITNIDIKNKEEYKEVKITFDENKEAIVKLDKAGRIIGYQNNYLVNCGGRFLHRNTILQEISLPNLKNCGNYFLYRNDTLQELNLPSLKECGDDFLHLNSVLKELNLPNLIYCGHDFLTDNNTIQKLNLPSLKECGDDFLHLNSVLKELNLPNLVKCGDNFLDTNDTLQELNLPNLVKCGDSFLDTNDTLHDLSLPNLIYCGHYFLTDNNTIQKLNLPSLKKCGNYFLPQNNVLQEINLPSLINCGYDFLYLTSYYNKSLQKIDLSKLSEESCQYLPLKFIESLDNKKKL